MYWALRHHIGCVLFCAFFSSEVNGHGFLRYPPSRGTLRDFGFENEPVNYDVNGQNCGGKYRQWQKNGGKCGVCGDPADAFPRQHEAPDGRFATGTIGESYREGGLLRAEVVVTWGHRGWMEFRLCPVNSKNRPATHACLDRYVLKLVGSSMSRIPVEAFGQRETIEVDLQLPPGLVCSQCVLQWKYHTGKDWDCGPERSCCVGCGPQEEFYGCADIRITRVGRTTTTPRPTTRSTRSTRTTTTTTTPRPTSRSSPRTTTRSTRNTRPTTSRQTTPRTRLPITTAITRRTTSRYEKYAAYWACKGVATTHPYIANWCRGNCPRNYCPRFLCNDECQKLVPYLI